MPQFWEEWTRKWLSCRINYWMGGNSFVPIPQEHKDDEHILQSHNDVSNSKEDDQQYCSLSLYEKFIINAKSETLPKQVLRTCSISGTNAHISKSNFLNTKQLLGITFFALTGVSCIYKLN